MSIKLVMESGSGIFRPELSADKSFLYSKGRGGQFRIAQLFEGESL